MKIETKFGPNDDAWFMHENKPIVGIVLAVSVCHRIGLRGIPLYVLQDKYKKEYHREEHLLFGTKEELIASL